MITVRSRWGIIAAIAVVLVVGVVVIVVTASGGDDAAVVMPDGTDDCREPGRDIGFRCDPGADVTSVRVSRDGDTLIIDVELDSAPVLSPDVEWRIQFNAASSPGKVCGISNLVDEEAPATETAIAYGYDPDFGLSPLTRKELPEGVCRATVDGTTVSFAIDTSDQDPAEEFRVVGFARIDFPFDDEQPGSEDDFFVDVSLSDL